MPSTQKEKSGLVNKSPKHIAQHTVVRKQKAFPILLLSEGPALPTTFAVL